MKKIFICSLFLSLSLLSVSIEAAQAEQFFNKPRTKDPFPKTPAHLYVPLPYSMPGIGSGMFLMAYLSNIKNTTADMALIAMQGDAQGYIGELDEVPIIKDRLHIKLSAMDISKAAINDYTTRGMASNSNIFNILDVSDVKQLGFELTLSFWQRRLELTTRYNDQKNTVSAIRNSAGELLAEFNPGNISDNISRSAGVMVDFTDDYFDPKEGFRFRLNYQDAPSNKNENPDFYVLDYSLLYYLPIHKDDTLVFNYYQSDAHVRRTGLLDPAAIQNALGINCPPADTACVEAGNQRVSNILNHNQNGTATPLGGTDRLRSYPAGRFEGGHMAFVGAEYRLNFLQDVRPFDFFVWKDIPTSIQLALFTELGSVSEKSSQLWSEKRLSYGLGLRLISKSGSVYRVGWAKGDEGSEVTVFFFYPWG